MDRKLSVFQVYTQTSLFLHPKCCLCLEEKPKNQLKNTHMTVKDGVWTFERLLSPNIKPARHQFYPLPTTGATGGATGSLFVPSFKLIIRDKTSGTFCAEIISLETTGCSSLNIWGKAPTNSFIPLFRPVSEILVWLWLWKRQVALWGRAISGLLKQRRPLVLHLGPSHDMKNKIWK